MKRYLVVSDSHTNRPCLVDLLNRYQDKVDQLFHCGDSQLPADDELWNSFIVVKGNCDFGKGYLDEQVYQNQLDKIVMTHGHLFNVNFTLSNLIYRAQELQGNMIFYGHTHILGAEMIEGCLVLNPGSIVQPRGRYNVKTYALIESDDTTITVYFYNDNHQLLPEFTCHFSK